MHDLLLDWCSERETGSIRHFREAFEWLRARDPQTKTSGAAIALRHLEELGHLEVDYASDKWAVTPPTITALPRSGGLAVLVGARPRQLMSRLFNLETDPDARLQEISENFWPDRIPAPAGREAPSTIYISNHDDGQLAELCTALGIRYEHRSSDRLLEILPSLDTFLGIGLVKAPPLGFEPQRMTFAHKVAFEPTESDKAAGAYEYLRYGPPRYLFNDGSQLFAGDRRIVIYAELRRIGEDVLVYDALSDELLVPGTCPLPLLFARSLCLRTGQLPVFHRQEPRVASKRGTAVFENVPSTMAHAIARRLGQTLTIA